jgi:hypothetical protein
MCGTGICAAEEPAPQVVVEKTASGAKLFRIVTPTVLVGKWHKPNAFYVLQRTALSFENDETVCPDVVDAIGRSTTRHPF